MTEWGEQIEHDLSGRRVAGPSFAGHIRPTDRLCRVLIADNPAAA
jgi:hypothetical protein